MLPSPFHDACRTLRKTDTATLVLGIEWTLEISWPVDFTLFHGPVTGPRRFPGPFRAAWTASLACTLLSLLAKGDSPLKHGENPWSSLDSWVEEVSTKSSEVNFFMTQRHSQQTWKFNPLPTQRWACLAHSLSFVYKILLEHSQPSALRIVGGCFHMTDSELSWQRQPGLKSPKTVAV